MTSVDTNIVVRFLTGDDHDRFRKAITLFNNETIFIPDTVWLETEWVLRFAYEFSPSAITQALRRLLGLPQVRVASASRLLLAVDWHDAGLDFADALHLASSQEIPSLVTFDKAFARKSNNLGTCRVTEL